MNNTIPSFLYDNKIYSYIESLVLKGVDDFYDLHEEEKDHITILIIDVLGADAYNIIIGSDDLDKTLNCFKNFLQTASREDAVETLYQMRTNALDHYAYSISLLFASIKSKHEYETKNEKGLIPITNIQTGELEWSRF